MRMHLSSLVKLVVGSALVLGYWRLTGWPGAAVAWVGLMMVVVPIALISVGRRFGDPILAGFFGGGLGFALWAVGWSIVAPSRLPPQTVFVFVPVGMTLGLFHGLMCAFGDSVRARRRPKSRGLAYRYDLVLFLFLIAAIASVWIIDEIRWVILPTAAPSPFTVPLFQNR
jgi:hypothetical protein